MATLQYADLPKRDAAHYSRAIMNPYIYDPNVPAAALGAATTILLSLILTYQYIRHRSYFFWTAQIGILMSTTGFISRLISATNEHAELPFLLAFTTILLAPSFLAAACYTAFSRVVWFSCPPHALRPRTLWVHPAYITPTFVAADLASFVVQLAAAAALARHYAHDTDPARSLAATEHKVRAARAVLVAGLVLQLGCYAAFAVVALRYFVLAPRWRADDLGDWAMWRRLSYLINAAAALVTLRAVYRTLEIPLDARSGLLYLQRHEWCFWCFDALPVMLVLLVMVVWHPGRYLPPTDRKSVV